MPRPPNAMPSPEGPASGSDLGPLERLIAGNRRFAARERRRTGRPGRRRARTGCSRRIGE